MKKVIRTETEVFEVKLERNTTNKKPTTYGVYINNELYYESCNLIFAKSVYNGI